jgi:hypothetical protein
MAHSHSLTNSRSRPSGRTAAIRSIVIELLARGSTGCLGLVIAVRRLADLRNGCKAVGASCKARYHRRVYRPYRLEAEIAAAAANGFGV